MNWKHYTFEIIAIFIGISASFWLEEWREDHQNRELLEENLRAIREELTRDTLNLDAKIDYMDSVIKLTYPILINGSVGFVDSRDLAAHLNALLWIGVRLEKNQAGYKSLVENGYGQYLRNAQLRKSLYDYYENRRIELLEYENDLKKIADRSEEMVMKYVRTADFGISLHEGKSESEMVRVVAAINEDFNRLLSDQFFRNNIEHELSYMAILTQGYFLGQEDGGIVTLPHHKVFIRKLIMMIDDELSN